MFFEALRANAVPRKQRPVHTLRVGRGEDLSPVLRRPAAAATAKAPLPPPRLKQSAKPKSAATIKTTAVTKGKKATVRVAAVSDEALMAGRNWANITEENTE